MKVIFLDIDGVLNTPSSAFQNGGFHPEMMQRLIRIIKDTGAKIVVSSSWRIGRIVEGSYYHKACKLNDPDDIVLNATIDYTPVDADLYGLGLKTHDLPSGYTRGHEIGYWIAENGPIDSFAILDDHDQMSELSKFLIKTDTHIGLTDELADEVVRRLNGTSKDSS